MATLGGTTIGPICTWPLLMLILLLLKPLALLILNSIQLGNHRSAHCRVYMMQHVIDHIALLLHGARSTGTSWPP